MAAPPHFQPIDRSRRALFDLPAEIRNRIYHYSFGNLVVYVSKYEGAALQTHCLTRFPLRLVCRAVKTETQGLARTAPLTVRYRTSSSIDTLPPVRQTLTPHRFSSIIDLRLTIGHDCRASWASRSIHSTLDYYRAFIHFTAQELAEHLPNLQVLAIVGRDTKALQTIASEVVEAHPALSRIVVTQVEAGRWQCEMR